ncbi:MULTISPECIES: hypothetical protein [unclassified Hyphomicrobium]|uniref:hypothetical protein n=1 Tax=unclassified Hyphomicrobium TaxID=2619925 RepID=UPI000213D8F9|nr:MULTISPECIES: hypothetical protein [unclassified Hyphomicrobium]CCB68146.1 conserved exported protein of unknown function [Hyphomicrobium sp. MC1]
MKSKLLIGVAAAALVSLGAGVANAGCMTKGAVATSTSADSAKWFAMETMVQNVSWGLWPGFLANGQVAGYKVVNKKYRCSPNGSMVTCHGRATFCKL